MSTILKALRRLENDDPKKKRAGAAPVLRDRPAAAPLSATDPRAADALRGRILAEEAAARVGAVPRDDESPRSSRLRPVVLGTLAASLVVGALAFALTKSGLFSSDPTIADTAQPSETAQPAPSTSQAAASPPPGADPANPSVPSTLASEPAAAPRAMVAVASPFAVAEQAPTETSAPSPSPAPVTPNVASAPSAPTPAPAMSPQPIARATPTPTQSVPPPSAARPAPDAPPAPSPQVRPSPPVAAKPSPTPPAPPAEAPGVVAARAPVPASVEVATVPPPSAAAAPSSSTPRPERSSASASAPAPVRTDEFKRVAPAGFAEVTVVRTAWHPKPERRSAKVRIAETNEIVTAHEGDTIAGLVLREITPSAVVFSSGDVEIRRRVGEKTANR